MGPLLFVICYNDLTDYITIAEVLQYADDTVLYFANSKVSLVLNLKKTKAEVMLCGTAIRILKSEELRLFYWGERILQSSCYKYLGNIVNLTATVSDDFDAKYKKTSSQLKKLWKIRGSFSVDARIKIYEMILPLLIYAFTLHLKLTDIQVLKLCNIERRTIDIMKSSTYKTKSIENIMKKQACILVKKSLSKNVYVTFLTILLWICTERTHKIMVYY